MVFFFFSSRRRHTRWTGDWSSDVCSSDLQDVFPEIATELGRLGNPAVVAVLRGLVGAYLRRADRIVAIGETMRERLEAQGASPERVRVIPNWVDTTAITPRPRENQW